MPSNISGIHHISLSCQGEAALEQAMIFYRDLLGIKVKRTWGEGNNTGAMLDTGDGIIELFANAIDLLPQGTIHHFALACTDVDTTIEAVEQAGYEIITRPKDIVIPSEVPCPARIAFCRGPVGVEIELFCEKECRDE